MRPFILPLCLAIALPGAAFAASNEAFFAPAADGTISFVMPSGNVGCTFVPAGGTPVYQTATGMEELHCTRIEPTYRVVILEHHLGGHTAFAPGEVPGLPMAPELPYGQFWQGGAFTCLSARSGLVCTNGSGAGLRMARAEIEVW